MPSMITEQIKQAVADSLKTFGVSQPEIDLEHPAELEYGDYATNAALAYAKELGQNPRQLAEQLTEALNQDSPEMIERMEVAGPGFINFYLTRGFLAQSLEDMAVHGPDFGRSDLLEGRRVMVEYTDPNPFKEFHAGHLMNNTVGEVISRLYEASGATVTRACYQGDVGPHVAKAVWGMLKYHTQMPDADASLDKKVAFMGEAYVAGSNAYEEDQSAKAEIERINRAIYEQTDEEISVIYDWGRQASLEHFETIYRKLGTSFDRYFFESRVFSDGQALVEEGLANGVFEKSEEAVVYRGEEDGLHTRVFITSQGLPTYETKELGLTKQKLETGDYDELVVVTAAEQTTYFQVVMAALAKLRPDWAARIRHIPHGMLQTPGGKMSSRKGNVIGGGTLIEDVEVKAREKIAESDRDLADRDQLATQEAAAAVKYAILKQAPGKDVIFDMEQSLSLEGDTGPYLQYTHTRCVSVLEKARAEGMEPKVSESPAEVYELERLLYRFPEVVERTFRELAPQHLTAYLTELASSFNSFYGREQIVDPGDPVSSYKLALTRAARTVLRNGLYILGIEAPDKM